MPRGKDAAEDPNSARSTSSVSNARGITTSQPSVINGSSGTIPVKNGGGSGGSGTGNVSSGLSGLQTPVRTVRISRRANGSFGITLKEVNLGGRTDSGDAGETTPLTYFTIEPISSAAAASKDKAATAAGGAASGEGVAEEDANTGASGGAIGLLPGDVLISVNAHRVEGLSRDQIVRIVQQTPANEQLVAQVQSLPEMFEINRLTVARAATASDTKRRGSSTFKPWVCLFYCLLCFECLFVGHVSTFTI